MNLFTTALFGQSGTNVVTRQYDLSRSGLQSREFVLNLSNVNSNQFGKLWETPTNARSDTQPLYVGSVPVNGVRHNVLYFATEQATLYALDADTGVQLWQTNLLPGTERAVATGDLPCQDVQPYGGSTATPTINWRSGTLYAETFSIDTGGIFRHRLHAIDFTTGAQKNGSPVGIQASGFTPSLQKSRPGLAFANGNIYVAFSSHCDKGAYGGFVFAYNATTLAQVAVFNAAATSVGSGIWQSDSGIAVDTDGSIFVVTGNGPWDGVSNFGESLLRLSPSLSVLDYFTPCNYAALNNVDGDLGSGGVLLLPQGIGVPGHPSMALTGGKGGTIYLTDRANLGKFQANSDSQIVQSISGQMAGPIFGGSAYFNGMIYISAKQDALKGFSIGPGGMSPQPVTQTASVVDYQSVTPAISAGGTSNGIVWLMANNSAGKNVLQAYKAGNLSNLLYSADQISNRDMITIGTAAKYQLPTIANGKVYVIADGSVAAYGLLSPPCASDVTSLVTVTAGPVQNNSQTVTITNPLNQALTGPFFLVFDGLSTNATVMNSNMTSSCATNVMGSFANHFPSDTLAPGASQSMTVNFFNPSGAATTYRPRIVTGSGRTITI